MLRFVFLTFFSIALIGCDNAAPPPNEYNAVMTAVLIHQPDNMKAHREFVREYPEQESIFDNLLDYRLCIAGETAGVSGDFKREDWSKKDQAPRFDQYSERWVKSKTRYIIPNKVLPDQLRWNNITSLCPSGVLRFGNPDIHSNTATVYVENTSWTHGYASEIRLKKVNGVWTVIEEVNWWQA